MTPERLLTRRDMAVLFQVTVKTIDSWCRDGILPYEVYPCGKRFDPRAIETFRHGRRFSALEAHHVNWG